MISIKAPAAGSWQAKALGRLIHIYFRMTRGMTMGVRAACFDADGRLFLVRHSYLAGWHMPGGGIERHETAEQALAKELREEGNLVMTGVPQLFHVYFNTAVSDRDHVLFYRVTVEQTAPRGADAEIVESGFFDLDALPADTTRATHNRLAELKAEQPPSALW